ncbi:hypothetical protein BDW74DRAFT_147885 [Aspergillus multicolor]|uniref:uncharacterized protein n=1 Tax=Aspergillus multicolor TaxID=41759 RepID=UPI003CCE3B5D
MAETLTVAYPLHASILCDFSCLTFGGSPLVYRLIIRDSRAPCRIRCLYPVDKPNQMK